MSPKRVAFVAGHEYAPESYQRVAVPSAALRRFGYQTTALGVADALERQVQPDVLWVHMPMGDRALQLIKRAAKGGAWVVVDFCEDIEMAQFIWEDGRYEQGQIEAAWGAIEAADSVVAVNRALATHMSERYNRIVKTVRPLLQDADFLDQIADPLPTENLVWWSDGRQNPGLGEYGTHLAEALEKGPLQDYRRFVHVQFANMKALRELDVTRQAAVLPAMTQLETVQSFRKHTASGIAGLELWPTAAYGTTVSDLSMMRYLALGVPVVTNRAVEVPGVSSFRGREELISRLEGLLDPNLRDTMATAGVGFAREYADSGLDEYKVVLEEA